MNTTRLGLRLDPLDPLLFRDGRPFDPAARVVGGPPGPQALAGALRTLLLTRLKFNFAAFTRARRDPKMSLADALRAGGAPHWWDQLCVRGPWPAVVLSAGEVEPLLPLPQVAYFSRDVHPDGRWHRAAPLGDDETPLGWHHPAGLLPVWHDHDADTKQTRPSVPLREVARFLADRRNDVRAANMIPAAAFMQPDDRVGIAIDVTRHTAADGKLYAVRFQALAPRVNGDELPEPAREWAGKELTYYAELVLPAGAAVSFDATTPTPMPFGGEGRYVGVRGVNAVNWPTAPTGGKALVYLASPAFFPGDHPLPLHTGAKVIAAASASGEAVSGWDVARNGPRATRFAVPAGGCYFFDGVPELPEHSLDPTHDNRREGWGFALTGRWD